MASEVIGGVVFALWTAAAFIGGWWAHKSMWSEDHERINAFWQEDRNRLDELELRLCESHQKALQAAHDLRPDTHVWQPKESHLTPFPTEFAKRVAELHALNTGRTGGATADESSAVAGSGENGE